MPTPSVGRFLWHNDYMERRGDKFYLSPDEQYTSGYSSPIDITIFDAEAEREAAVDKLDQLEAERAKAVDDPENNMIALREFERAYMRQRICAEIIYSSRELLIGSLVQSGIEQFEEYLEQHNR